MKSPLLQERPRFQGRLFRMYLFRMYMVEMLAPLRLSLVQFPPGFKASPCALLGASFNKSVENQPWMRTKRINGQALRRMEARELDILPCTSR
jgi:hypothetical protein